MRKTIYPWEKKGRPKYFQNYPNPPLLDMKLENRDINVVEQANIPQFSKLNDIGSPLRPFESFFVDCVS